MSRPGTLRIRWLGTVPYREALAVQQALFDRGPSSTCCCSSTPCIHVRAALGPRQQPAMRSRDPSAPTWSASAAGVTSPTTARPARRLSDHRREQPARRRRARAQHRAAGHRHLARFGVAAGRLGDYPGVWVDADGPAPRKICAIGVRLKGGRTMHGFALNVTTDMAYLREHIVAAASRTGRSPRWPRRVCTWRCATSWTPFPGSPPSGGGTGSPSVRTSRGGTVPRISRRSREEPAPVSPSARPPGRARLAAAGVASGLSINTRKPDWLRPKVHHGAEVLALRRTVRELGLVTVCEDAGCPNLSECWADGTATFMVLGDRCTRACGFCLVDTRQPSRAGGRRAAARRRSHRPDGPRSRGAHDGRPRRPRRRRDGSRRRVRRAIRERRPGTRVETLISDVQGREASLAAAARRPSRRVQPQRRDRCPPAARRPTVRRVCPQPLGAGPGQGGPADDEVGADRRDGRDRRRGRRLPRRPRRRRRRHRHHRPVPPPDLASPAGRALGRTRPIRRMEAAGQALGIGHVEASPLTRSSYHAKAAADVIRRHPSCV